MSEFTNVTVSKEANVYFDGQVTSRTIIFADGTRKTLGVMLPGDYEFGTEVKELMEITSGELDVLLPGDSEVAGVYRRYGFRSARQCQIWRQGAPGYQLCLLILCLILGHNR